LNGARVTGIVERTRGMSPRGFAFGGWVMRYRSAACGFAFVLVVSLQSGICLAQTAPTAPAGTLQEAAAAHARGDYPSARQIFQFLAERGNVTAQFDLAVMNANGQGAPANMQEALKWYRAAAEQGDAESFANLATMFENGGGVPLDYVKAFLLFDAASRLARGDAAQNARAHRDALAGKMATAQLVQTQNLARLCQAEPIKACSARILAGDAFNAGSQALDTPMVIKLEQDHGVFVVPVTVNGTMSVKFIVDSGASDMVIPADLVSSLMASGTLSQSDFIGEGVAVLADGSKRKIQAFRLHSVRLGNLLLENVTASVSPVNAPPLLGQSFLNRLKSWSLDNATHTLIVK
jgi:clan AA aspartic protease (TIGR02281 family)